LRRTKMKNKKYAYTNKIKNKIKYKNIKQ